MAALLLAMQQSLTLTKSKTDGMCARMDAISIKLQKRDGRLTEAEQQISTVDDSLLPVRTYAADGEAPEGYSCQE
ncbi:hypothetical protein NDU88_004061 [Pleurodeles waltl]|uniref:Uncharacterized protein n=1 Tax=Pleurodeles waltl TaxID=8319 RepID=A0AAV7V3C5_PLEWA|nr:hypothetical protein NDU88_004061 [Pleurodeles waltl]